MTQQRHAFSAMKINSAESIGLILWACHAALNLTRGVIAFRACGKWRAGTANKASCLVLCFGKSWRTCNVSACMSLQRTFKVASEGHAT